MSQINSVCVYCGSRFGNRPEFTELARRLGERLAKTGIRLIYGGGRIGLMGVVADAVLAHGGHVIGVIPQNLHDLEVGHNLVDELHIVEDMHSRKAMMFDLSDAFITLPGGIGTLDETIEVTTWKQLRQHEKPIILVDQDNYWRPYLDLVDHVIANDFASPETAALFEVVSDLDELMALLKTL